MLLSALIGSWKSQQLTKSAISQESGFTHQTQDIQSWLLQTSARILRQLWCSAMNSIQLAEVRHGSLRIVRRCRVVTYMVGEDENGQQIQTEISESQANALLSAIAQAQKGNR